MAEPAISPLAEDLRAAFAWWKDAGVDYAFHDEPADWLAVPELPNEADRRPANPFRPDGLQVSSRGEAEAADTAAPAIDPASLPQDMAAFAAWWLTEPLLDEGRTSGRVPPRGQAGAELMVVVPEPESDDGVQLLSGPQGRLLDAMLAAMELGADAAYVASALPRHKPMADWDAAAAQGIGLALRRHVELVAPRRIMTFGRNVLPLLGNDPPNSAQMLQSFNHQSGSIPLLAAPDLAALLNRPQAKARLWQQWLEWTGD